MTISTYLELPKSQTVRMDSEANPASSSNSRACSTWGDVLGFSFVVLHDKAKKTLHGYLFGGGESDCFTQLI